MSLLLRNACQPAMDLAGLANFHIRVAEHTKTMTIVGECGQPFVSISGIQFARVAPNKEEMPLAVELLEAFLVTHKLQFDAYVQEMAKFMAMVEISQDTDIFEIRSIGYNDDQEWLCKIHTGCFKVELRQDGSVYAIEIASASPRISADKIAKGPNIMDLKQGLQHLKDFINYNDARNHVNSMKAKLSSCEI